MARFTESARNMLGQIPGLLAIEVGEALQVTKEHAHGYDWGVVVTLKTPADFEVYAKHPAHDEYDLCSLEEELANW